MHPADYDLEPAIVDGAVWNGRNLFSPLDAHEPPRTRLSVYAKAALYMGERVDAAPVPHDYIPTLQGRGSVRPNAGRKPGRCRLCACGCGGKLPRGVVGFVNPRRYLDGHSLTARRSEGRAA